MQVPGPLAGPITLSLTTHISNIAGGWPTDEALAPQLFTGIQNLLSSPDWEQRLGGLKLTNVIFRQCIQSQDTSTLVDTTLRACTQLLEDSEVRVRWAVGDTLRIVSGLLGVVVWEHMKEPILASIQTNFDRDTSEPSSRLPPPSPDDDVVSSLLASSYRPLPPGQGDMRHGTEGWKCLETSFRALQHIMEGCGGPQFRPYIDASLRALVYRALRHPNRFVREACQFILGSIAVSFKGTEEYYELMDLLPELCAELALGLSDNWSQVRYAASTSTRRLLVEACESQEQRDAALKLLIPHMALNRYYVAEGVRLYSQETWRLVTDGRGKEWVAGCAPEVVSYYIQQSKADNHAVREAACACIAEMMSKVDEEAVSPFVPRLLKALMGCFKDASWPVRDAACLACGQAVRAFPEESRSILEELYALWFAHLWDNIYSVREDSAVALGDAARAYGEEAVARICKEVRDMLPKAHVQPADSKKAAGLENTTLFGVAAQRAERANDADLHTDRTMFSCGSLAPKLQRGGGCVDHGFAREKEPWEASDGAVYMLRELSAVAPEQVVAFLPGLADISRLCHFSHCLVLQENIWKQLPVIAKNVGKKAFKAHLEDFLDPMFKGLVCGHRLCEVASGRCIAQLRDFIGVGIFTGRLTEEQQKLMMQCPDIK